MIKDKELEELFLANKPKFDDGDAFMASLDKRLDAVEYLKQYEAATMRHYKYGMIAAFVFGIVCGGIILMIMFCTPANVPLYTFKVQSDMLMLIEQNSRFIATVILSALVGGGSICIFNLVNDISFTYGMKR